MPFWRQSPKIWNKDDNAGPVTEADLAVNEMLKDRLLSARPDFGWLSEETEDSADRLDCESVFIVDPIDGTRAFIAGERTWSHSIAVSHRGEITHACVYLPATGKMYTAQSRQGAYLNGQPIAQSGRKGIDQARVLSAKPNFHESHWPGGIPDVQRHFRTSLAYRMALIAEGRFDAMITFRDTWEWDVAAGTLLAKEAGATVTDRLGKAPIFNNRHPALAGIIAGAPAVQHALINRTKS